MTTQQPDALIPDEKTVMAQAQVYASTWAIVGSRFDAGDGLELAEQEKTILADMVRRLGARIADLEAQLEAIGAGGVSGPLIGQPQAMPDLSQLTERGAKAWAGVDAQGLREGFTAVDMATAAAQGFRDGVAKGQQAMWRHIETAPKDGQAILVTDGMDCYCVEWDEEFDWWTVDDNKLGPFRLRGSAPTHWMPLPAAPGPADGESNG